MKAEHVTGKAELGVVGAELGVVGAELHWAHQVARAMMAEKTQNMIFVSHSRQH